MTENTDSRPARRWRLIFYNLLVFFVVANALYWAIPVVDGVAALARWSGLASAARNLPPGYADTDAGWVRKHWVEVDRLTSVYKSYIGWRRAPSHGDTINIAGPYLQRKTVNSDTRPDRKAYFFGGSTMWGNGVGDAGTIPSQFAAITRIHSENFGEGAWVAHQSLMMLVNLLQAGHRPDLVVFYDGANDVLQKCRTGIPADAHGREQQFDNVLRRSGNPYGFSHYLAPILTAAENLARALPGGVEGSGHDCDVDRHKAEAVAEALVRDWEYAEHLAQWRGGKFVGLLQPVSYHSRTPRDHLSLSKEHERQYAAVYPLIKGKIAQRAAFHDLVSVLNVDDAVYLDWAHLSPKGNRYVAQKIAEIVAPLGFNR